MSLHVANRMQTAEPTRHAARDANCCDHCGLTFNGPGYLSEDGHRFCCYGCCLVQKIIGVHGEEGIATWILVRLGIGAFFAMNVMMISMLLYADPDGLSASTVATFRWALLILSAPALVILAGTSILGGIRGMLQRRLTMDMLIATGSVAAYGVSAVHVIAGNGHLYFDTATMLPLIVTIGRLMEASAKGRASKSVQEMMELMPASAHVLRDGREVEIPAKEVHEGDLMLIRPGERIPTDGRILSGECMIEESAFTGETRPRSCAPGANTFGGSVNIDGLITVEATSVGADSLLARIREMVRESRLHRAPVERVAERFAALLVPVVWALAAAAFAYWGFVWHDYARAGLSALAVLVVACPCALGLATPLATSVAIGKAARMGVLIRSGEILERLPAISRVYFDKTGTVTDNRLLLHDIRSSEDVTPDELLSCAASVAAGSEHAVAKSILAAALCRGVTFEQASDLRAIPGHGVQALVKLGVEPISVTMGSLRLLSKEHRVPIELAADDDGDAFTHTYLGWDGAVQGIIRLRDHPRPEAGSAIQALKVIGVEAALISGDREGPTQRLASDLGITSIHSECTPVDKVDLIRQARTGGAVAMVGDGINDAPSLAEADVGVSIGSGTDLARQSCDVVLLGNDLSRIPWLLDLSRTTYRTIRQNLWWAFGYNSIAVSLAFMGYVHPLIAATAMLLSSLSVIGNSMRIAREDGSPAFPFGQHRSAQTLRIKAGN